VVAVLEGYQNHELSKCGSSYVVNVFSSSYYYYYYYYYYRHSRRSYACSGPDWPIRSQ